MSTKQNYGIVVVRQGRHRAGHSRLFGETTNFNDDIIFVDGQFVQYPAGAQR